MKSCWFTRLSVEQNHPFSGDLDLEKKKPQRTTPKAEFCVRYQGQSSAQQTKPRQLLLGTRLTYPTWPGTKVQQKGTSLESYIPLLSHLLKYLLDSKLLSWATGLPPSWWLGRVVLSPPSSMLQWGANPETIWCLFLSLADFSFPPSAEWTASSPCVSLMFLPCMTDISHWGKKKNLLLG